MRVYYEIPVKGTSCKDQISKIPFILSPLQTPRYEIPSTKSQIYEILV